MEAVVSGLIPFQPLGYLGARRIILSSKLAGQDGSSSLDRSPFAFPSVEMYPVGNWQGTGSNVPCTQQGYWKGVLTEEWD